MTARVELQSKTILLDVQDCMVCLGMRGSGAVTSIYLTPETARAMARRLMERADEAEQRGPPPLRPVS